MKTKKILPSLLAFIFMTALAGTVRAQELAYLTDYHEQEYEQINNSIKELHRDALKTEQQKYLDINQVLTIINEDLPVNYKKLMKSAFYSIKDNKISYEEQYNLMSLCIERHNDDVLMALIMGGFDPLIDSILNENLQQGQPKFISLIAKSVIANDYDAFSMMFNHDQKIIHSVISELEYDMALIGRFADFALRTGKINLQK